MDSFNGKPTLMGVFEAAIQRSLQQVSSRRNVDVDVMIDILRTTLAEGQSGFSSLGIDPRSPATPGVKLRQGDVDDDEDDEDDEDESDSADGTDPSDGTDPDDGVNPDDGDNLDDGGNLGGNERAGRRGSQPCEQCGKLLAAGSVYHHNLRFHQQGSLVQCALNDFNHPAALCNKAFRNEDAHRDHRHTCHHHYIAGEPGADKERTTSAAWLRRVSAGVIGRRILVERGIVNETKQRCRQYNETLEALGIEYYAEEELDSQLKAVDDTVLRNLSKRQLIVELIATREEWAAWEVTEGDMFRLISENEVDAEDSGEVDVEDLEMAAEGPGEMMDVEDLSEVDSEDVEMDI
ncbi:hypothetical protein B0H67DRAFT_639344 [Lasiosphaeris hirsuta]|uniref:Uncharacterized protein n=1 Tax=Lasiosphaeris hirsuta TaxID=260670 RepID=A0AA40EB81_9PEZI|nr:hypothetical protein B0H67DRAFT_639344 [Lasiosphaeris hirsuta]